MLLVLTSIPFEFDDGPLPPSPRLYDFLQQNNQRATHFFIGENMLQYWQEFKQAITNGDDIAFVLFYCSYRSILTFILFIILHSVHTWTHPVRVI
jgi:peptidoglycan/xylan/chitin deacetylase (PgdA/CDA1 family)